LIQFNSETLFTDGDPVTLLLIFPWGHPNIRTIQHFHRHKYNTTPIHQTNNNE